MRSEQPANERFKKLAEKWFLREPAFLAIYCTHELRENMAMKCAVRVGNGLIEYNDVYLAKLSDYAFEELMALEMIRVFLKHPYLRRPENCPTGTLIAASDMTLFEKYRLDYFYLISPGYFSLPSDQHFEWYCANIPSVSGNSLDGGNGYNLPGDIEKESQKSDEDYSHDDGDDNNQRNFGTQPNNDAGTVDDENAGTADSENAGTADGENAGTQDYEPLTNVPGNLGERETLWGEDELRCVEINQLIEKCESSKQWGIIAERFSEMIIASIKSRIDYRKVLAGFRASIFSTKRHLTRMKPSRRFNFEQMGSCYDFSTKLLIAVDCSGSINSQTLTRFYGIINKFFKYGVPAIDVLQFDAKIQGELLTLKTAQKEKIKVCGRGGTDFQPVFDFVATHREYDGLVILTDGYAPVPKVRKTRTKIVWVCPNEETYNKHRDWMCEIGHACYIF